LDFSRSAVAKERIRPRRVKKALQRETGRDSVRVGDVVALDDYVPVFRKVTERHIRTTCFLFDCEQYLAFFASTEKNSLVYNNTK
jgi:hypothetical protein